MPCDAFVLKIQRELCHPKCSRKVSGLSRNGHLDFEETITLEPTTHTSGHRFISQVSKHALIQKGKLSLNSGLVTILYWITTFLPCKLCFCSIFTVTGLLMPLSVHRCNRSFPFNCITNNGTFPRVTISCLNLRKQEACWEFTEEWI